MTDEKKAVRARRRLPPKLRATKKKKGRAKQSESSDKTQELLDDREIAQWVQSRKIVKGFPLSIETRRAIEILQPQLKDFADIAKSHHLLKTNPPRTRNTTGECPASIVVEMAILYLLSRYDKLEGPEEREKFLRHVYRIVDRQFLGSELAEEMGGVDL